jgi:tRNA dimethylallyltransferase
MGPTASGKTRLALRLVEYFPFEIISVDSAMIYRGMDIGTAKPTSQELELVPHHLINICDPKDLYSAGQFREDALVKIEEIHVRGKVPLLVGGTMLYFSVLQQGISDLPKSDEKVRVKIKAMLDEEGLGALYLRLQRVDLKSAKLIQKSDSQRIQRALEVYEITGKSLSELKDISPPKKLPYEVINFVVFHREIAKLRAKIKTRFQNMIGAGFIDEVQKLYQRQDLHPNLPSMRTVGYRQIWQYLVGEISYDEMFKLVPIVTGQLAKRQLTWLRRWQGSKWFDSDDPNLISNVINLIKI